MYLVDLDPLALATAPPLVRWATEMWYALMDPETHPRAAWAIGDAQLTAWWAARHVELVTSWRAVNGPMSAAAMSAARLGWNVHDPTQWHNEWGDLIDLRAVAPSKVERQVRATATRMAEIAVADRYGRLEHRDGLMEETVPDEAFDAPGKQRAHLCIIRKVLRSRAADALTWKPKIALRAAVCVAVWAQERRAESGYRVPLRCARCGGGPVVHHGRVWRCPDEEAAALRVEMAGEEICKEARQHGEYGPQRALFEMGVAPSWADDMAPPFRVRMYTP